MWRGVNGLRELQLYSEKCTGYFKERDDDLSSKQGSIQNETYSKIFLSIYLHIFIFVLTLKHNMNIFLCKFDK